MTEFFDLVYSNLVFFIAFLCVICEIFEIFKYFVEL
jgi:hypothetical protein